MSLNAIIDAKISSRCGRTSILNDPERERKQLEQEQRKQRLLEVREQSKKIAQQIRENVAAEKERHLLNWRAAKEQEYSCWRDQVLAQHANDNRQAIFQVGAAHRAAQLEKEQMAARAAAKTANYQQFRKQLKARRSCANQENQQNKANVNKPIKKSVLTCTGTQTTCPIRVECHCERTQPVKRKRHKCNHEKSLCCCSSDSESSTGSGDDESSNSCSSDTTSTEEEEAEEEQRPTCSRSRSTAKLKQTPAVLVDVEADSSDSITITAPYEMQDNHVETNRQFSAIIRVSPSRKSKNNQKPPPPSSTKTQATTKKQPRTKSPTKTATQPQKPKSPVKKNTAKQSPKPNKPRYTQISDLLQGKKSQSADKPQTSPRKSRSPPPKVPPSTPKSLTPRKSPRKTTTTTTTTTASTKSIGTKKLSSDAASGSQPASRYNAAVDTKSVGCGSGASTGFVRFYDYNNKYTKCCPSLGNAERESLFTDQNVLNAMEQACIEKQMRECREREINDIQKRTEQRGQMAIERERVRRDCMELTEKLDTLMQQHPNLLPSDANLRPAYLAAKANARREDKSANAIEEILLRPAIITCPEVKTQEKSPNKQKSTSKRSLAYEINLGSMVPPPTNGAKDNINSTTNTTDSCCSILLGYVNDQSKQIQNDINQCGTNTLVGEGEATEKAERLRNLLQRIECLRDLMLKEINKASETNENVPMTTDANNMQQVIDSISSMRKERENILMDGIQRDAGKATAQPQLVSEREKELQQKEAILEQKVREFYDMQKGQQKETVKHNIEGVCANKPLEIIIKVKGDGKCVSKLKKSNANKAKKSPRKVSGLLQSSSGKTPIKKPTSARIAKQSKAPAPAPARQNSYDSTSTSYRSLPPALTNSVDAMLTEFMGKSKSNRQNGEVVQQTQKTRTHMNPLVAHYIQRLLGMSRKCIETLGVSSSDIQTPSSSIINTTANRSAFSLEPQPTEDEFGLSQERLVCVEKFIEENRSFINELEESMRQQTTQCLEESMRVFEEIWKQRLLKTKQPKQQQKPQNKHKPTGRHETHGTANKRMSKTSTTPRASKERSSGEKAAQSSATAERQKQKSTESMRRQQSRSPRSSADQRLVVAKGNVGAVPKDADEASPTTSNPDTRIVRYEQLTTNCTQRIAELTSLINRVREEKQRLLEVTLSSVSEGGRNSTEYMDLPADKNGKTDNQTREVLPKRLSPNQMDTEQQLPSMDGAPLEKHKPIGRSRDSGISLSRPVTSLEQNSEGGAAATATEPSSYASTHTVSSNSSSQQKAKVRPPPTLRRFSPQLSLEDDVAHELSTILEIDTPGTTRVGNASNNTKAATINEQSDSGNAAALPVAFPTFEEYARQLNLDLTHMDPEKSLRIQHEFDELIANLKAVENDKDFNYEEFPSLTTYMKTVGPETTAEQQQYSDAAPPPETSTDSVEELLACLRLANLTVKSFPTRKEYMSQLGTANQSATAPPVGMMSTSNDTDSDSTLNIEAELKRRNIMTHSFRNDDQGGGGTTETTTETREEVHVVNSTVRSGSGEMSRMCAQLLGPESGIDKLSSTTSESTSGDLERELLSLGIKWPTTMRRKCQEAEGRAQSSSTSPQPDGCCPEPPRPRQPPRQREKRQLTFDDRIDCSSNAESVHPINLRDFLTRELLKHTSTSCSTTSGDDSLKSNFLNSIIGSITPGCTPTPPPHRPPWSSSSNGACRQKTSTPVIDSQSSPSRARHTCTSSTTTQLFSGESHLSSVHGESNCANANQNRCSATQPDNCDN